MPRLRRRRRHSTSTPPPSSPPSSPPPSSPPIPQSPITNSIIPHSTTLEPEQPPSSSPPLPPPSPPPPPSMPRALIFSSIVPGSIDQPPQSPITNGIIPHSTTLEQAPAPEQPPPPPALVFSSVVPGSIDQPPQSWLEMGLSGHSLAFSFHLNNQEIIMDVQDPGYVAQIITEGMRLGIEAYYRNNPGRELPFFHPEQPGGPVLAPPIQTLIDPPVEVPTSDPSRSSTHGTSQIEEDTTPLPSMALQQGIRPKVYVLSSMKSFIIEEEYIKKYILMCPVRLTKCTMDIRVLKTANSKKKFAVLLVPTPIDPPDDGDKDDEEAPKMGLIIWNCRGSEQSNFRKSFRDMLDYHRPKMVLLIETHMTHHQHLADDFGFTDIANVPGIEGCGGMALVWKKDFVGIDGLVINSEELHCTIHVQ